MASKMGAGQKSRSLPKSIRHQRILDLAAERPEASMETIAEEVPSATADLVEHVLDEYGDPADESDTEKIGEEASGQVPKQLTVSKLTDSQLETLQTIAEHPEATQAEIGEHLGVSAPTVSNRVNAIDGFEWQHRQKAVEMVDPIDTVDSKETQENMATNETESTVNMDQLVERVAALETKIEDGDNRSETTLDLDAELAQKMIHACIKSDSISEDEELELLKAILSDST